MGGFRPIMLVIREHLYAAIYTQCAPAFELPASARSEASRSSGGHGGFGGGMPRLQEHAGTASSPSLRLRTTHGRDRASPLRRSAAAQAARVERDLVGTAHARIRAAVGLETPGMPAVACFYRLSPYFRRHGVLLGEKQQLTSAVAALEAVIQSWDEDRRAELARTQRRSSVVQTLKEVALRERQAREVGGLKDKVAHANSLLRRFALGSDLDKRAEVVGMFTSLSEPDKRVRLLRARLLPGC